MKSQHVKILRYLSLNNQRIPSQKLADAIGCSKRSIKTYIGEINLSYPETISSSNRGYKGDIPKMAQLLEKEADVIPQSQTERTTFILKSLVDATEPIDLFDLSDELLVSDSTIKLDLKAIKSEIVESNLYLVIERNEVQLLGTERDKRKLLSTILFSEAEGNFFDIKRIKSNFHGLDFDSISDIVIEIFSKHDYFTNDYALNNIVLHIMIAIDRMLNNFTWNSPNIAVDMSDKPHIMASEIATKLNHKFSVSYSHEEINDLAVLIASSGTNVNFMQANDTPLEELAGEECLALVKEIILNIETNYYISIIEKNILTRFTMHIKNLLMRIENNYSIKNPMTDTIKRECPLIYDCAVHASLVIKEQTGYQINNDEIAYIAFHIGYALEYQKQNSNKLTCSVVCPFYYNMNIEIINKLGQYFGDDLKIENIITNESDIELIKSDLIVSTMQLNKIPKSDFVVITPFFSNKDRENISKKISELKELKQKQMLKQNLEYMLSENHFLHTSQFKKRDDALKFICEIMKNDSYVDDSFFSSVTQRELMSSTAFGMVAVPHSIKMDARRTGIFVLTNPAGIMWGNTKVKIVLLMTVSKEDRKIFRDVFDTLASIFTEDRNVLVLSEAKNYTQFIDILLSLLK